MRQLLSVALIASVIGGSLFLSANAPAEARHNHRFGNYYNNQNGFSSGTNSLNPTTNTYNGISPFNTNQFGHHRNHHHNFGQYNNSLLNNGIPSQYNGYHHNGWNNNWNGQAGTPNNWSNNFNGNGNAPRGNAWGNWHKHMQHGNAPSW